MERITLMQLPRFTRKVELTDLQRQRGELREEMDKAVQLVLNGDTLLFGREVAAFEKEFAEYCGVKHCVGVGSGLDALALAMKAHGIGPGDEIILAANTFIGAALAITQVGATPVLVDHDPDTFNIDPRRIPAAITSRTRAVIPVHLYGRPADMDQIRIIADEHGLIVLEDASQAHGARYAGRRCGSLGDAAGFSFRPQANLGACGDAGAVVTDDEEIADRIRRLRNFGSMVKYHHEDLGVSSRLDAVQAAILRVKLRHLDHWNDRRRQLADRYQMLLSDLPLVPPTGTETDQHVYHLFVIRCAHRDRLLNFLAERNIHAGIHYPVPIHWQPAYEDNCIASAPLSCTESLCGELLSLPLHPHMTFEEVEIVVEGIRDFFDQVASAYIETRVRTTVAAGTT